MGGEGGDSDFVPPERVECKPYICPFPEAEGRRPGTLWTCPGCGARYRLTRRKYRWPWRNWSAPHGYWTLTRRSESGVFGR